MGARAPCPLNAGHRDARLSLTARRQAAGERRGEGEPELDRRSAAVPPAVNYHTRSESKSSALPGQRLPIA